MSARPYSRRGFLLGFAALGLNAQQDAVEKGQSFPPDSRRYADAATEFPVIRLTSPQYSSYLSAPYNRSMAGRNTLYFTCDRTGKPQVFRADVRNGQTRQLTDGEAIDPLTPALGQSDRFLFYCDGPAIQMLNTANLKDRELYRPPTGWERGSGFSISPDGARAYLVERSGENHRISAVNTRTGAAAPIVEAAEPLADPIPRPTGGGLLYRRRGVLWMSAADGQNARKLALAPGEALSPTWSPDGASLLYLNVSPERGQLNTLRELNLQSTTNKLLAKTTQYVAFGSNSDASVFVGASGSKASPHVLILIRSVGRELTLCEHRAKDTSILRPIFAPSSQRVLFGSDQHGKPAIYTMNVERFVEETES